MWKRKSGHFVEMSSCSPHTNRQKIKELICGEHKDIGTTKWISSYPFSLLCFSVATRLVRSASAWWWPRKREEKEGFKELLGGIGPKDWTSSTT